MGPEEQHIETPAAELETESSKTAYDFFVLSIFQNTKSNVSEDKVGMGFSRSVKLVFIIRFLQLLKLCEEKWKYMNEEEKETFVEMEAQERERMRTERMTAVREDDEESEVELSDEEMAELTMHAHDDSGEDSDQLIFPFGGQNLSVSSTVVIHQH